MSDKFIRKEEEKHASNLVKYRDSFFQVFNMNLTEFYITGFYLVGFDVLKFNDKLNVPDGVSLHDFVKKKYGESGDFLIKELLCIKENKEK